MKKKFKIEFKKQLRLAIAAAIGFLIAFSWRDFLFDLTRTAIIKLTLMTNVHFVGFFSAFFVSLVGVLLILLSSRLLE